MAILDAVHYFKNITILSPILHLRFTTANQWQQVLVKLSAAKHFS